MKKKNKALWEIAGVSLALAGILTLLPWPLARAESILGYMAACPFSPISTVLLLYGALLIKGYLREP